MPLWNIVFSVLVTAASSVSFAAVNSECYVTTNGQKAQLPTVSNIYMKLYSLEFQLIQNPAGKIDIKPFTEKDAVEIASEMPSIENENGRVPLISPLLAKLNLYFWKKEIAARVMTAQVRVYPTSNEIRPEDSLHLLIGDLENDPTTNAMITRVVTTAGNPEPLSYRAPFVKLDGNYDQTLLKVFCDPVK